MDLNPFQIFKTMHSESLKLYLVADLKPRKPPTIKLTHADNISIMDLAEEVWLTQDKVDACCILETYQDKLSEYETALLRWVIFGHDIILNIESDLSYMVLIQRFLDKILF